MNTLQRRRLAELQTLYRHHRILAHGGDQQTRFSCPTCSGHLRRTLTFQAEHGDRKAYERLNHNETRLFGDQPEEQPGLPLTIVSQT